MLLRWRRKAGGLLLAVLVAGLVGFASSVLASATPCCPDAAGAERPSAPPPCQWVISAACCDAAPAVEATSRVGPARASVCVTSAWTNAAAPPSPSTLGPVVAQAGKAALSTVILRL